MADDGDGDGFATTSAKLHWPNAYLPDTFGDGDGDGTLFPLQSNAISRFFYCVIPSQCSGDGTGGDGDGDGDGLEDAVSTMETSTS